MKCTKTATCSLLAFFLLAAHASAEEYDFELDVDFGSTNSDFESTFSPITGGTVFSSSSRDTDNLSILGSWYFAGLSDNVGPRARAELVNRASSLTLGYARTEETDKGLTTLVGITQPFVPAPYRFESDGDSYGMNLRYVDRDSGWFGGAGWQSSEISFGGSVSGLDTTEWQVGVGKYIFETTTLGLDVTQIDGRFSDATVVALSFEHLGDLGEDWQYAIDIGYDRLDGDFSFELDSWSASAALYPNRDLEFGVTITDTPDGTTERYGNGYEAFASWFVKPNISLSARYRVEDVDTFSGTIEGQGTQVSDADQSTFGISATWRFD